MRINPWKLFHGAFVPNWLLLRKEVTQGAKLAYARLSEYAGVKGFAFPGEKALALSLGVEVRQCRRYISELVAFKLIETENQGMGKTNRYYFLAHPWMSYREVIYDLSERSDMTPIKDSEEKTQKSNDFNTTKKFRHVIPEGMALTEERFDIARGAGVNDPAAEWGKFHTYYKSIGTKAIDWDGVWRTWCMKQWVNSPPPGSAAPPPQRRLTKREERHYDAAGLQNIKDILAGLEVKK